MKEVTLHIPDNKYPFFMELMKSLKFVKTSDEMSQNQQNIDILGDSNKKVVKNIKAGLDEVRLFQQGKLETTSAKAFLDEL
jgi:hypothetical protein